MEACVCQSIARKRHDVLRPCFGLLFSSPADAGQSGPVARRGSQAERSGPRCGGACCCPGIGQALLPFSPRRSEVGIAGSLPDKDLGTFRWYSRMPVRNLLCGMPDFVRGSIGAESAVHRCQQCRTLGGRSRLVTFAAPSDFQASAAAPFGKWVFPVTHDDSRSAFPPAISLRLLHATQGHALQTWYFEQQSLVRIGRLDSGDVVITDPRVSRLHAELRFENGAWQLASHGRHGVFQHDKLLIRPTTTLSHGAVFQLGPGGPQLEFLEVDDSGGLEAETACSTIEFDCVDLSALGFDKREAAEQVQQIAGDDNFRQLLERAASLRKKRQPPLGER